jgi:predicted alpha/beta hydrolase family esterase
MNQNTEATILIVPGLRDHVAQHWQTLLEAKLSKTRKVRSVPPLETDKLSHAARVAALNKVVSEIDGPIIMVAHSGGCITVAHWAQEHQREIKGVLLAAPPDFESPMPEGYPSNEALEQNGWLPTPRTKLPFVSIVAASTNDPLGKLDRVSELAEVWGSGLVNVGAVGHLNPASGYGEWPAAEDFIRYLDGE